MKKETNKRITRRKGYFGFDFGQITSMKISFDGSAECEPYYNNPMDDVIYMMKKL